MSYLGLLTPLDRFREASDLLHDAVRLRLTDSKRPLAIAVAMTCQDLAMDDIFADEERER